MKHTIFLLVLVSVFIKSQIAHCDDKIDILSKYGAPQGKATSEKYEVWVYKYGIVSFDRKTGALSAIEGKPGKKPKKKEEPKVKKAKTLENIKFYSSKRKYPYQTTVLAKYETKQEAIDSLIEQFGVKEKDVITAIVGSNKLSEIHENLRQAKLNNLLNPDHPNSTIEFPVINER